MFRRAAPLILAVLAGCARPEELPNVILVTLDTVRADRIGHYGRPDVRTPVLDAWARGGAIVQSTIADVPLTLPSHVTILTGVPAPGHGVRTNANARLSERARTLAEVMSEAGYRTAAVVSSLVLEAGTGIDQGFDRFDDDLESPYEMQDPTLFPATTHWLPEVDRRAGEALDRALARIDPSRPPFFLWLHLYDPHFPYDAPAPWPVVQPDPYLAELEATDRALARLERRLESSGLAPRTVLVVTADHGEGLDDHREDEHGILVYDEAVRVPLLVRAPGVVPRATVVPGQARTIDVAPTILSLAGIDRGAFGLGESLVPRLLDPRQEPHSTWAYSESIKSRVAYSATGLKAIRSDDTKFVWAPRPEIYDLVSDPGELANLAGTHPDEVRRLAGELRDALRGILDGTESWAEPPARDERTLSNLRSLGYMAGGESGRLPFDEEMRPVGFDPKDVVDVAMAGRDVVNGFHDRAERKLRRFLASAPSLEDDPSLAPLRSLAHQNLGAVHMQRDDFAGAIESYRAALSARTNEDAAWSLVFALNLAGRPEEAVATATRLRETLPGSWRLRLHRALGLVLAGRRGDGRRELAAIAEESPDEETRGIAALYRDKIGTDEEEHYLDVYRRR